MVDTLEPHGRSLNLRSEAALQSPVDLDDDVRQVVGGLDDKVGSSLQRKQINSTKLCFATTAFTNTDCTSTKLITISW